MIHYKVLSEDASDHWPYFDVNNKNVLDIGCGIWYTGDMEQTSPVFFGKTAKKVIGIDANDSDIQKYKEYTNNDVKFIFEKILIQDVNQVRDILHKYEITALKCDIEGDERILLNLTSKDLENVTEIAIEFHTLELKDQFMKAIPEWGFEIKCIADFLGAPENMGIIFGNK
jgi:SAM-dependent methyltransferase